MKTTIETSNSLLDEARKLAAREKTTVRALVEQGLRQVFFNLLSNAVDAVNQGGTIAIRASRQSGGYEMRITDSGPGIDAGIAATLFEPYVTGKPQGTGLGLTVARQIVRGHGGELTGASAPGGGAVFTLTLPLPPSP